MDTDNTILHTDIKENGWVDRVCPAFIRPYAYLSRIDRPIGVWLLLLPAWWALFLSAGRPSSLNEHDLKLLALFALGAIVMRAAGCVINDLWDRNIDKKVERTKFRPLASGALKPRHALLFLFLLLATGLAILLTLSPVAILLGILTIPLILLYPLMKRITWWPQAFLGLTFNFGALIGWAAMTEIVSLPALLLYSAGIFWTLGYDTIYAHQDKEDDALTGIKSLALKLGENSKKWIIGFYGLSWLLILSAFITAHAGLISCIMLVPAGIHLIWQIKSWDLNDPQSSLKIFKSNRNFGLLVVFAALLSTGSTNAKTQLSIMSVKAQGAAVQRQQPVSELHSGY